MVDNIIFDSYYQKLILLFANLTRGHSYAEPFLLLSSLFFFAGGDTEEVMPKVYTNNATVSKSMFISLSSLYFLFILVTVK